ncbi:hypothetical protein H310_06186 [Aphanomyces invadans]|uniref:Uncharacterized protein n=1 Tax=Aphanomyces invadans TaxID=157072 RepID=A0A024U5N2_9STRA|nr:hypothetical protein H310_06186 [Aphanomyces invadans]ETW01525.1 hypothetical protein H310_06186 [Aphanomyces invadans]|eukprot:XP_008869373.1 hypothetical protein H310_06186 [Aphanomyces invadans]
MLQKDMSRLDLRPAIQLPHIPNAAEATHADVASQCVADSTSTHGRWTSHDISATSTAPVKNSDHISISRTALVECGPAVAPCECLHVAMSDRVGFARQLAPPSKRPTTCEEKASCPTPTCCSVITPCDWGRDDVHQPPPLCSGGGARGCPRRTDSRRQYGPSCWRNSFHAITNMLQTTGRSRR